MKQTERRYEWLYGDELFDLIDEQPLAWLPLGILEKHGGHRPWGLDGLKAHAVCTRLATELQPGETLTSDCVLRMTLPTAPDPAPAPTATP